jgi:tripartite-type tricarboxylate transporter receptor subunit TctC
VISDVLKKHSPILIAALRCKRWGGFMLKFFHLIVGIFCLGGMDFVGGIARSQDLFPSRQVRVIVPFPPGSTLDALVRIVTDQLAQKWKHPVIVENLSGGGGNIGTRRFARSSPDGYTLLFAPPGPFTINPLLYTEVSYIGR